MIEGKSIRNEADRFMRSTERFDLRQNRLIQRSRNCLNSQFEENNLEHSCGSMTDVYNFLAQMPCTGLASFIKKNRLKFCDYSSLIIKE